MNDKIPDLQAALEELGDASDLAIVKCAQAEASAKAARNPMSGTLMALCHRFADAGIKVDELRATRGKAVRK